MIDFTPKELTVLIDSVKLKMKAMQGTVEPGTDTEAMAVLVTNLMSRLKSELAIREME